ncbi:MAG: hypothetical protein E6G83_20870 [Alphaproteobacteria bacterium]|nr:MAG: hypothetical protein E6G83_20870 [Alphaproteobacteria bacterium]
MSSLLKSTVLSLGVLAGTAAVALAQSVSALPPGGPATPSYSAGKIVPSTGNNAKWQEQRGQPAASDQADKWQILVPDHTDNHTARLRQYLS